MIIKTLKPYKGRDKTKREYEDTRKFDGETRNEKNDQMMDKTPDS